MKDDFGGAVALLLMPIAILIVLVTCVGYVAMFIAALAVPVGIGVGTNLMIRFCANDANLQETDEQRIWRWIIGMALVPFVAGGLTVLFVSEGIRTGETWMGFLALGYLLWLAGYVFACFDPRFEQGKADVLMAKTLITAWTRFQMRRGLRKLRRKLPDLVDLKTCDRRKKCHLLSVLKRWFI